MGYAKRSVDGSGVCCADFPVDPFDRYFRITVVDFDNNIANTNAYFVDDILESEA